MKSKLNSAIHWTGRLFMLSIFFFINSYIASAQMPPPGYEREKKLQEEQMKVSILDRDSITLIDTVVVFDPNTY
ncbi:MAG: hypothetical protein ABIQ02_03455, partial [Saprospiraceae bacterium]